jgi:hypothetical protein
MESRPGRKSLEDGTSPKLFARFPRSKVERVEKLSERLETTQSEILRLGVVLVLNLFGEGQPEN